LLTENLVDAFPPKLANDRETELPDRKSISETDEIPPDGYALTDSKQFGWLIRRFSDENINSYT
jgi:hypothetical protein